MPREKKPSVEWQIVIDTREQLPFSFQNVESASGYRFTGQERGTLDVGDYSPALVAGGGREILPVAVERKTLSDLYASVTRGRQRFEREMGRAVDGHIQLHVVVESDFAGVGSSPSKTTVTPKVVYHTIASWAVRYGIHFWMPGHRSTAQAWAFRLLEFAIRQRHKRDIP